MIMSGMDINYGGALIAGILSFLSPCVLPLVPPYLCFLGGISIDQISNDQKIHPSMSQRVFISAFAFVLGFSTVFVGLGATATAFGKVITDHIDDLTKIAGCIIIIMGLHFMGVFRISILFRDSRFHMKSKPSGLAGSYVIGLAFAFGWTPCVGPILTTILFIAASEDSISYGLSLLATYSAGLGIPLLLAAFATHSFMGFMLKFKRQMPMIEKIIGTLLVITGILFFIDSINIVGFWLLEHFPSLGGFG
jgi:cytochrome c-type biogenesis protein